MTRPTWTLCDPDGAERATGPNQAEVLRTVCPGVRPTGTKRWDELVAAGWTVTRDPPLTSDEYTTYRVTLAAAAADARAAVLAAAMAEARAVGFQWIRRADVANRAAVSAGAVSNAYGGLLGLKRAVLAEAVRIGDAAIVAQGLADGHPIAKSAPQAVKDRAAELLTA